MGKPERSKGARGELEARDVLRNLLTDPSIARVLDQPRDGGFDLDGLSLRHFAVEVKRARTPLFRLWLDKLIEAHPDRIPVVMWRSDRDHWSYILRLSGVELSQYVRLVNCIRDGHHP